MVRPRAIPAALIFVAALALVPASHAGWEVADRVPGRILDADTDRILFVDTNDTLRLKDRATLSVTTVPLPAGEVPDYGYLTSHGAIFVAGGPSVLDKHVYEWRDGSVIDLGFPNSNTSLAVAGSFASWSGGSIESPALFRRDLEAGTTITVSTTAGDTDNDVAANGDVVFWRSGDYEIFRYRAGATTQLTSHASRWNTYPRTDGINVVFRNTSPCCATEDGSIVIHTGGGQEVPLDSFRNDWPEPDFEYAAAGGWVAYTKAGLGSSREVWARSPAGVHRQASPPGMDAWIVGLGPTGELVLFDRTTRHHHYARPSGGVIDLGPAGNYFYSQVKWLNGIWYELRGAALNELRIASYVRPRLASPVRASLVTAYRSCQSPNRQHGPPLVADSCAPPDLASDHLTAGTADSNPNPAGFQGSVRLRVVAGNAATVADEADVLLDVSVSDVRRGDNLADYTGELEGRLAVELTDKESTDNPGGGEATIQGTTPVQVTTSAPHGLATGAQVSIDGARFATCANGSWIVTVTGTDTFTLDHSEACGSDPGGLLWSEHAEVGPSAATTAPLPIRFSVPCASTPDPDIGASCAASTTADAVVPGLVHEAVRTIWQLGGIEVYDGGPDGDADTPAGNTLFARQGVFVP